MRVQPECAVSAEDRIAASVLRIRARMPFFGALALFVEHVVSAQVPTAATDGRTVFFNPEFAASLKPSELDAVMVHELLHAALLHQTRRARRDPRLWNIAADIVVNGIIRTEKHLALPDGAVVDPVLAKFEVEEVYERLLGSKREFVFEWIGADLLEPGDGSHECAEALRAHWRDAIRHAQTLVESVAGGKVPRGMLRHVGQVTDPPLDWRTLLWRFLVRTPVDFAGFDRRFIGRGMYLEELAGETVRVRVAVDTSGSISSAELGVFLSEVREILSLYPGLEGELYFADSALYGPYEFSEEGMRRSRGGGGTSFVPFFRRMELEGDGNGVLIYLTDGHGTFPREAPAQEVLWVVSAGGLASAEFPFGTVARLGMG
jgi:hypothetical protein